MDDLAGSVWDSVVKERANLKRYALGVAFFYAFRKSCHTRTYPLTRRDHSAGEGMTSGKSGKSVFLTMRSLRRSLVEAAVSAHELSLCLLLLVAAARKLRFDASRAGPSCRDGTGL